MNAALTAVSLTLSLLFLHAGCELPAPAPDEAPAAPRILLQESGSDALLIGISPVNAETVWVAGTSGTFGRTTNGGSTWHMGLVEGADSLQFRDVHAIDAERAYLLSIGNGQDSRIYYTADAGSSWALQFVNVREPAFYNCFDFWDPSHGMVFSDAIEGSFPVIETADHGRTWTPVQLPEAYEGEGGFASSGTCVQTMGDSTVWIGTGAGEQARILRSDNRGQTWASFEVPLIQGTATSGITSLSFLDHQQGIIAGGDIASPDTYQKNIAFTTDGGQSWTDGGRPSFAGALYGIAYVPGTEGPGAIAAGPGGLNYSLDGGRSWAALDTLNYWSVAFTENKTGWATGTEGKILKIVFP